MDRQRPATACLPTAIAALNLSLSGSHVSPETFRLAKFDRPQAVGIQVRFVKCAALSYGYRRLKFYQLPSNGSEGSRELLLAFSWFLCRIALMEKLLTLRRVKLWDEATVCMCNPPLKRLQDVKNFSPKTHLEDQRDIQYLQWLNGCLRLQWRSYHMEQQEQCKLLYKVHSYTMGSRTDPIIGHFSVTEVEVGRQPDNYKQETVLDTETEEEQDCNMYHKDSLLPGINLGCYSISRITEELDQCREALLSLCQELHELITIRKLGCYGKVGTNKEEQEESNFCRSVKKVQETVEQKLSDLTCNSSAYRISTLHGPYRLVLKQKCLKRGQTVAPNEVPAEGISATHVIRDLKKSEARLKALLEQQQEEDGQKVHRAASGLGQVLFIPPMKRQKAK